MQAANAESGEALASVAYRPMYTALVFQNQHRIDKRRPLWGETRRSVEENDWPASSVRGLCIFVSTYHLRILFGDSMLEKFSTGRGCFGCGRIWPRESGDLYYKQTQHKGGTKMESIVMFDIKELAKEVGFRKMLREIGTYKDLDEKVEAELDQLRRMEENDDFLLEEGEEMPEE